MTTLKQKGEAAFYGPKLDIQVKTALGNEETLSTIQLDFLLPERFDLKYIGADGEEHRPVMIHRGVISTMERFTAILIENYKGAFPTWLAPQQVTVIPVSNEAPQIMLGKLLNNFVTVVSVLKWMNVTRKCNTRFVRLKHKNPLSIDCW